MPFIRDHTKVANNVLMGPFSVSGAFEWLMRRYKIMVLPRYQVGPIISVMDDNYWAALTAGEEEEIEALEFIE